MKKCELCEDEEATGMAGSISRGWILSGPCNMEGPYFYYLNKEDLDNDKKFKEWIDHLSKKNWFNISEFMACYRRLFK